MERIIKTSGLTSIYRLDSQKIVYGNINFSEIKKPSQLVREIYKVKSSLPSPLVLIFSRLNSLVPQAARALDLSGLTMSESLVSVLVSISHTVVLHVQRSFNSFRYEITPS